jgi:DegV family protein with EDD domain
MFHIVTDSSADMPEGWAESYDISILPINIQVGNKTYRQGIDLDNDGFYRMVEEQKIIPKTSLPSVQQVVDFFQQIADQGDTILSIHLASTLSGTFSVVQMASQEVVSRFKVLPFDSGGGSALLAFMCQEARLLERDGAPAQVILNRLDFIRRKMTVIFTIDTLDFALLSGRVNRLQAALSSFLQIKPIIILKDGLLDMAEKVRTRQKALERVLELVQKRVGEKKVNIAVVHARDLTTARFLADQVKRLFNVKEMIMTELSISVVAHMGPRTVGIVAYPVEED